ncbi:uncharacterized protein LTR77_010361 [Saxophila tyrrhenica]|uniref:Uncharacterized protein n=1 Tax=Saxophila tyrrhenica TaxID=1690608 RepID=A0AAV9NW59_9PEZI|nr:hypothetical protein LTR77_010361 [Saxophila tyrrhenica]
MGHNPSLNGAGLPRLPLDLHRYEKNIAIFWSVLILSSGILPIVGYFALHYGTDLELNIVLAPFLGFTGVTSIFSLIKRSWELTKKDSNCRPLGQQSRWGLDFFGWNFLFGFIALTMLISLGIGLEVLRAVSLPLSVLVFYVCLELLLAQALMAAGVRAPLRISSVAKGQVLRPGSYVIVEDVVAVDGGQGQGFRRAWNERYEASRAMRTHLRKMDLMWAGSGMVLVAVVVGVVFGAEEREVGYAVGWSLPWVWAGTMAYITTQLSKAMLIKEAREQQHAGV